LQLWKTYVYNKYIPRHGAFKLIQMTKTRKLTATFADGTQATRTTARTYTHVVRAFHNDIPFFLTWCGRPDLMEKQVEKAKNWVKEPNANVRVEVATVTDNQGANN